MGNVIISLLEVYC